MFSLKKSGPKKTGLGSGLLMIPHPLGEGFMLRTKRVLHAKFEKTEKCMIE